MARRNKAGRHLRSRLPVNRSGTVVIRSTKLHLLWALVLSTLAFGQSDVPKLRIQCEATNPRGIWYVMVHQQGLDGFQKPVHYEGPFKSGDKAVKRCSEIVKQWQKLNTAKKSKGKSSQ